MRKEDGTLIDMTDRCPHRWAPLSMGRIESGTLRCMYLGVRFGADGRCVEVPGQEKIPSALKVRTFAVIERHKWAWIRPRENIRTFGDAERRSTADAYRSGRSTTVRIKVRSPNAYS